MSEKCFDRCCRNASGSLTTSEKTCLSNCHDMYFKTIDVVADTLNHLNAQAQQKSFVSFIKQIHPRQTQPRIQSITSLSSLHVDCRAVPSSPHPKQNSFLIPSNSLYHQFILIISQSLWLAIPSAFSCFFFHFFRHITHQHRCIIDRIDRI